MYVFFVVFLCSSLSVTFAKSPDRPSVLFRKLQSLTLTSSFVLVENDFCELLQRWKLRRLLVHTCTLSRNFFRRFATEAGVRLQLLCVSGCRQVDAELVQLIAEKCAELKWLILGTSCGIKSTKWTDELLAIWPSKTVSVCETPVCCLATHSYVMHRENCLRICFK